MNRTLAIIKPDITKVNKQDAVNELIINSGFKIIASKTKHLTRKEAEGFYEIHKDRPFFNDLIDYMMSGPVIPQVLEFNGNAVAQFRKIIGATDPKSAEDGTIRAIFGSSIEANAIHGSDSYENAAREIEFFFKIEELNGV